MSLTVDREPLDGRLPLKSMIPPEHSEPFSVEEPHSDAECELVLRHPMTRDLAGLLTDKLHAPVIGTEELRSRYLFGPKQLLSLVGYAAVAVLFYIAAIRV